MKKNLNYPYLYLLMIFIGAGSQAEGNEMKTRCKQMLWSVRTPVCISVSQRSQRSARGPRRHHNCAECLL